MKGWRGGGRVEDRVISAKMPAPALYLIPWSCAGKGQVDSSAPQGGRGPGAAFVGRESGEAGYELSRGRHQQPGYRTGPGWGEVEGDGLCDACYAQGRHKH